jgi:opacity protein-like surface antigen
MSDFFKTASDLTKTYFQNDFQRTEREVQSPVNQTFRSSDKYDPANQSARVMGVVQERLFSYVARSTSSESVSSNEKASEASKNQASKNDFSPEAVSQRIIGFVGNYMDKLRDGGASEERLKTVFESAQSAVTQGIEDATEKLSSLNWLTNDVQNNIASTQTQIEKGFESLSERFFEPQAQLETSEASRGVAVSSETQYRQTSSTEIQIETRDGDKVSLSLSALEAYQSQVSAAKVENENGSATAFSRYTSSQSEFAFEFSLDGELDDAELEAINSLVNDLADVADTFFSGDMKSAFEQGLKLGYNSDELSGFAMELNYSESIRQSSAAAAYGRNQGSAADGLGQSVIKPLAEFNKELTEISEKFSAQFENMQEIATQTLNRIFEMRSELEEKKQYIAEIFGFTNALFSNALSKNSDINKDASSTGNAVEGVVENSEGSTSKA